MGRAASRSRPPSSSKAALRRRVALIASVGARASPSLPRCWLLGCRPLAASAADAALCTGRGATAKCWNLHLRSDRRAFERGRMAESSARASRIRPPAANAETATRLGGGPRGQLLRGESQARQNAAPRLRPGRSWARGGKTNGAPTPLQWAGGAKYRTQYVPSIVTTNYAVP